MHVFTGFYHGYTRPHFLLCNVNMIVGLKLCWSDWPLLWLLSRWATKEAAFPSGRPRDCLATCTPQLPDPPLEINTEPQWWAHYTNTPSHTQCLYMAKSWSVFVCLYAGRVRLWFAHLSPLRSLFPGRLAALLDGGLRHWCRHTP